MKVSTEVPERCPDCGSTFTISPATKYVEWMACWTIVGRPKPDLRPVYTQAAFCNGCERIIEL
jgi:hypothetical protein